MAQIKTENLNELFSGSKLYKIPDYQRGYSWQKRQLLDFGMTYKISIMIESTIQGNYQ